MNDMARLSALLLVLVSIGTASIVALESGTRPTPSPTGRPESWRNQRYIVQSMANPSRWEALEVMDYDPGAFVRTELTPSQARRWMEAGGFQRVEFREYMDLLLIADSYRKGSELARAAEARRVPVRVATVD